ncbi:MAG: aminomethyl transferase family protein [Calditrichaeota bacterium]|nr:MAG: aminomethyl transferase family protein [Calditrichota bacterium]
MPEPTPLYSRIAPLCQSGEWRNWSGYLAPIKYGASHEAEYFAIRNAVALIDVSPLFKYEITGPDAARLVDRIVTRDISKCRVGQVMYTPWCDEEGKMLDDGTVQRLGEQHFRITSATPNLWWFQECGFGMHVEVKDISREVAALAIQGPRSRDVLLEVVNETEDLAALKFFRLTRATLGDVPVIITRTGYTGDLGYEIWIPGAGAEQVWDILMEAGRGHGMIPTGLDALDIARIEAGLILIDVDYVSARKALIEARKSSPFEAGLGWTVKFTGSDFVGRRALLAEKERGPKWQLVGLEADWREIERAFAEVDLPPLVAGRASRLAVPVYARGSLLGSRERQIGQATSSTFSPVLKKFIALATIESRYAQPGTGVHLEFTVEFRRRVIPARVVRTPFYDPPHKRK